MSILREWARKLGGDVVGPQVLCPGPGHSEMDRSMVVKQSVNAPGGFVTHSFAGDDYRDCRDHVATLIGLPLFTPGERRRPLPVRQEPAAPSKDTAQLAGLLWGKGLAARDTLGERYLRQVRGIRCAPPPTMRFLPARGKHPAALMTAFALPHEPEPGVLSMSGVEVRAIHRVLMNPDGTKADKKMLGPPDGLPLVVAPFTDSLGLVIAEGVEDALAAHEAMGTAAWAGGSAGHMAKLAPIVPRWVETVTIIQDNNDAGRSATRSLAEALSARGIEVVIMEGTARD